MADSRCTAGVCYVVCDRGRGCACIDSDPSRNGVCSCWCTSSNANDVEEFLSSNEGIEKVGTVSLNTKVTLCIKKSTLAEAAVFLSKFYEGKITIPAKEAFRLVDLEVQNTAFSEVLMCLGLT